MDMESLLNLKFQALADPTRRAILARLAKGEASVADLSRPFQISQPAMSKHLKVLETAGLVTAGRSAASRPRRLAIDGLRDTTDWTSSVRQLWSESFDKLADYLNSESSSQESEQS